MLPNAAVFWKRVSTLPRECGLGSYWLMPMFCVCHCRLQAQLLSCTTWKLRFPSIWWCYGFIFLLCQITLDALCTPPERSSVQCSVKGKLDVPVLRMATVRFKLSRLPCAVLWKLHSLHLEPLYTEVEPPSYFSRNLMILEGSFKTCILLPTTPWHFKL